MKTIHTCLLILGIIYSLNGQSTYYFIHNMPDVLPVHLYFDNQSVGERIGYFQQTHFDFFATADSINVRVESITGQLILEQKLAVPQNDFVYVILDGNQPNVRTLEPESGGYVFYSSINDPMLEMEVNGDTVAIQQDSFSVLPELNGLDSIIFTDPQGMTFSALWDTRFYNLEHFILLTNRDIFLPKGFQFFAYLPDGHSIKLGNRQKLVFKTPPKKPQVPTLQLYNNASQNVSFSYADTSGILEPFHATPMRLVDTGVVSLSYSFGDIQGDTTLLIEENSKLALIFQEDRFNESFLLSSFDLAEIVANTGSFKTLFYHGVQDGSPFDFSVNQEVVSSGILFSNFSDTLEIPTDAAVLGIRPTGFLEDLLPFPNDFSALESSVSLLVAGGFLGNDPLFQLNFVMPDGQVLNVQEEINWTPPAVDDQDTVSLSFSLVNFLGRKVDLYWQDSLIAENISQDIQLPSICIGQRGGNLSIAGLKDSLLNLPIVFDNEMNTLVLQNIADSVSALQLPLLESKPNIASFALYNLSTDTLVTNIDSMVQVEPQGFQSLELTEPVRMEVVWQDRTLAYQIDLEFWEGKSGYLIFSVQNRPRLLTVLEGGGTFEIYPQ